MVSNGGIFPAGFARFTTDGLPNDSRVPQWERHNADALVGLKAYPDGVSPLRAIELNLALPQLMLARITGTAHRVRRDETEVAANPARGVVAYLALRGAGNFVHRDGVETVRPGQGIIVDADQPFEREFADGLTELAVKIPRDVLPQRTVGAGVARPHLFEFAAAGTGPGPRLAQLAGAALSLRQVAWEPLEAELISLVASLLSSDDAADHLSAAEAFIDVHCHRPEISAAEIARAVGISERHLSRVFSESGRSVPRAVLDARLDEALRVLSAPELADTSMSEIATRCGFSSQAQFSRDYRRRFGVPPLQHRRALLGMR